MQKKTNALKNETMPKAKRKRRARGRKENETHPLANYEMEIRQHG